jgi:hypothetical protein
MNPAKSKRPVTGKPKRRAEKRTPSRQVTFRLKKILDDYSEQGHGTIQKMVEATGLERHLVSNLIQGKVRSISWETLALVCQYLHDKHNLDVAELPGSLFGFEAAEFWSMLAKCNVAVTLGVRSVDRIEPRWVNAYDAYLLGALIKGLFQLGHEEASELGQHLVRSYSTREDLPLVLDESQRVYDMFSGGIGDRAILSLGSVKSNPISERIVAEVFGVRAFESQDGVRSPKHRSCPFYLQFRRRDPQPPSCHGGLKLGSGKAHLPGVHYETKAGHWEYCPATKTEDAAVVLYSYQPHEGTMQLMLAGFSGRATGAIALQLQRLSLDLWPPNYERQHVKLGAFIIRYEFDEDGKSEDRTNPILIEPKHTTLIRLDEEVLKRRLG